MTARGVVEEVLASPPDAVFATLTDIAGLPSWNPAIIRVLETPAVLRPGAEWVVEMSALGSRWPSRSQVEVLDRAARRLQHRSATDDGNPSWARWTWQVDPHPAGCRVQVSWELHPTTFWRWALLARIRNRQLSRHEVPASMRALASRL